jgi:ParB-like nuclease domain
MKKHSISALVFDYDLYPRGSVDSQHASEIAASMEAGVSMPPIIIDAKSKRVIDGFHRGKAYRRLHGESYEVDCIEKHYKTEAEMFLDAMRYNASHGRALTQHDKAHCLLLAEKFSIEPDAVSKALNLTPDRMGQLRSTRIGSASGQPIALKRTIQHMAGKELTPGQAAANDRSSGMQQLFYANQLIDLIENDLVDTSNSDLIEGLRRLSELLNEFSKKKAA